MSTSAPDLQIYPYAGWVPTAVGRLSFRHIGETAHPTKSIYANLSADDARYILAYQRRPLSDVLFSSVLHYICNVRGDFWFALSAVSETAPSDDDDISGKIFVFKSKSDWRDHEAPVRDAIRNLDKLRLSLDINRASEARDVFLTASEYLKASADIEIEFFLKRSGEVFFSVPQFTDDALEYASIEYASRLGHDFPKWVADQAYFFLRDCCQQHQHHESTSDTILILQKRDKEDVVWRKYIIFSLYHYIIRNKRFSDLRSLHQSKGMLAYCNAFRNVCKIELSAKFSAIPTFDDASLAASIDARASEEDSRITHEISNAGVRLAKAANIRTFAFAIVALVISLVAMFVQPRISSEHAERFPVVNRVSDFATEHVASILALALVFLVGIWTYTSRDWSAKWRIGRDILEVSQGRRWTIAMVLLVVALVPLSLIVWTVGHPALQSWADMLRSASDLF